MGDFSTKDPTDQVIDQVRALIADGTYTPGMRLPSERVFADQMRTTRGYVRKALQRLELYGIVQIKPQSGVFIAEMGVGALEGLISNILTMDPRSVGDFIETRSHLESLSAKLAAIRADEEHLKAIQLAHEEYIKAFDNDENTLEADHLFHLAIVGASSNGVLRSLISLLTPDIIALNRNFVEKHDVNYRSTPEEHQQIVDAIAGHRLEEAADAMSRHMEASKFRRMGENRSE